MNLSIKTINLEAKIIQKYAKFKVPKLIEKATLPFNAFIRKRDAGECCITCGKPAKLQAGHFYSGGAYPALKFNTDNTNGQCMQCNYYANDLDKYRENLIKKIGLERVEELDSLAAYYKKCDFKWERIALIEIIETFKNK
jgi:hypothetical protein